MSTCNNIAGSYTCNCHPGFVHESGSNTTCEGNSRKDIYVLALNNLKSYLYLIFTPSFQTLTSPSPLHDFSTRLNLFIIFCPYINIDTTHMQSKRLVSHTSVPCTTLYDTVQYILYNTVQCVLYNTVQCILYNTVQCILYNTVQCILYNTVQCILYNTVQCVLYNTVQCILYNTVQCILYDTVQCILYNTVQCILYNTVQCILYNTVQCILYNTVQCILLKYTCIRSCTGQSTQVSRYSSVSIFGFETGFHPNTPCLSVHCSFNCQPSHA